MSDPKGDVCGDLIAWIGIDATFCLVETFGGTRVYIPAKATKDNRIAQKIGLPATEILSSHLGGNSIRVPLGRQWRIRVYRERGYSYAKIARTVSCTDTMVAKVLQTMGMTRKRLAGASSATKQRKSRIKGNTAYA